MQVSTHNTVRSPWLTLLVILVLCAGLGSPVSWAESQQQEIELQSERSTDSSEDDNVITGYMPGLTINGFPLPSPLLTKRLPLVMGSDAYSSLILHGPPTPEYLV